MRKFVALHPDYKQDSVVSETICYDLMNTFDRIARGELGAPELFGKPTSKTSDVLTKKCLEIKEEMAKIEPAKWADKRTTAENTSDNVSSKPGRLMIIMPQRQV